MRIPDYRNVHGVKGPNYWTPKANRVDKTHEDEFEKELEDSIRKRKSESKNKERKSLTLNKELDKMQLETDHLFIEYEQTNESETGIDLNDENLSNASQFSSWG